MADTDEINYRFSAEELDALKPFGSVEMHMAGDVLVAEGCTKADMIVTLSGQTDIVIATEDGEKRVGWMEEGQFAGDLSVLTGQTHISRIVMGIDGAILRIAHDSFQNLLAGNPDFSDIFVRVLSARRSYSQGRDFAAVIVIGAGEDRNVYGLRDLLTKHGVPHRWIDPQDGPTAGRLFRERSIDPTQLPVVLVGAKKALVQPSPTDVAAALGLNALPDGAYADVVVVGAGPAGLAASVYAASEGLSVVALDTLAPGGQAGTSSKIENYLGFPTGISGGDLAQRAAVQAQKFGAKLVAPVTVDSLERLADGYCLTLADGRGLKGRAVVIATGAQYQRLPIDEIERFEGRGVYYGATAMEAQMCAGTEVAVVGAGNSAGQGAMYLAGTAAKVHVVYRKGDIRETMSEYLVKRLEEHPKIILHPSTEVVALHGAGDETGALRQVTFQNRDSGERTLCDCGYLFLFIGAAPYTKWLPKAMVCDAKGFVKTGTDITPIELVKAGWAIDRMPTRYETAWPRVYAVGDVRLGSVKRVASGVGEGSVVVSDIHRALAEDQM